jgi:hypothetical protein
MIVFTRLDIVKFVRHSEHPSVGVAIFRRPQIPLSLIRHQVIVCIHTYVFNVWSWIFHEHQFLDGFRVKRRNNNKKTNLLKLVDVDFFQNGTIHYAQSVVVLIFSIRPVFQA